jgi:endonuclease YncB( thermonuclease family)
MNKEELELTTPQFSLNGQKMWGRVVNVYDGDTLTIALNVFNNVYKFSVRMNGIDTCEIKSKNEKNKELACISRSRLLSLITGKDISETSTWNDRRKINNILSKTVYCIWVECLEFDKYGRLLANIYKDDNSKEYFSQILINEKLAYEYKGDTKLTEEEQVDVLQI